MPCIFCTEKEIYARHLTVIVRSTMSLAGDTLVAHSLYSVGFTSVYDALHILTIFDYWLEKIVFEQSYSMRARSRLFVNWHCVGIFAI